MKCYKMLSTALVVLSVFSASSAALAEMATKQECIAKVQAAVKLATVKGEEEAIKQIGDKAGPFVWKDSYVIATTSDQTITLAHPIKPDLVGKNLMAIKDVNGVMFFAEISRIASSPEGKGWVDYMWPKPGEKDPSPKHSYVEKVPGMNVAIIAGYHD